MQSAFLKFNSLCRLSAATLSAVHQHLMARQDTLRGIFIPSNNGNDSEQRQ